MILMSSLKRLIAEKNATFLHDTQEDLQEFLNALVDFLKEDLNQGIATKGNNKPGGMAMRDVERVRLRCEFSRLYIPELVSVIAND
jgi:ubiquitin C-terminal hydrolase